jgi:hypothetical protein
MAYSHPKSVLLLDIGTGLANRLGGIDSWRRVFWMNLQECKPRVQTLLAKAEEVIE